MTGTKPSADEVLRALESTVTVADAARLLGISERTLYRRMGDYQIRLRRVVHVKEAA